MPTMLQSNLARKNAVSIKTLYIYIYINNRTVTLSMTRLRPIFSIYISTYLFLKWRLSILVCKRNYNIISIIK